jgi:hypothetical protein
MKEVQLYTNPSPRGTSFSLILILLPYSSFRDWCYGKTQSREHGTKGVLTADEENQLVECLIEMCK